MPNDITRLYPVRTTNTNDTASAELSEALNSWMERNGAPALFRTCGSCWFMTKDGRPAFCTHYQMTPPVDIILKGCDEFKDDSEIPF